MSLLTRQDIEQRLPHRAPILMLDQVLQWELDSNLSATLALTADNSVFAGHFPEQPILPGVLQIEALAQAAALLVALSRDYTTQDARYLFAGIEQAKFKQLVTPPTKMLWEVEQTAQRGDIYKFTGVAKTEENISASAQFTAKVVKLNTER